MECRCSKCQREILVFHMCPETLEYRKIAHYCMTLPPQRWVQRMLSWNIAVWKGLSWWRMQRRISIVGWIWSTFLSWGDLALRIDLRCPVYRGHLRKQASLDLTSTFPQKPVLCCNLPPYRGVIAIQLDLRGRSKYSRPPGFQDRARRTDKLRKFCLD